MTSTQKPGGGKLQNYRPWSVIHPLSEEDSVVVAALRAVVAPMKGKFEGPAGRGPFNGIMERVAVPEGVIFEAATVGGIPGWWAKSAQGQKRAAIVHVHGGWFNWGTAQAFRNFGQESGTGRKAGQRAGKRDRYDIDKMGSFGLWFGDATYRAGRSWWNGFSRLESRRGANAVVRESGRLPSIRAGFAGYS